MNKPAKDCLLTINGGSSSIKYALYEISDTLDQLLSGEMDGIGTGKAKLSFIHLKKAQDPQVDIPVANHTEAAEWLVDWLEKETEFIRIKAVGHRIVQGMEHSSPEKITDKLLKELKAISAYDPEHLPAEIELTEVFRKRYPDLDQVACFDTSFHAAMPDMAKLIPIPQKYRDNGIKERICDELQFLGIELDETKNIKNEAVISTDGSKASVRVIKTNEELMIARSVCITLNYSIKQ